MWELHQEGTASQYGSEEIFKHKFSSPDTSLAGGYKYPFPDSGSKTHTLSLGFVDQKQKIGYWAVSIQCFLVGRITRDLKVGIYLAAPKFWTLSVEIWRPAGSSPAATHQTRLPTCHDASSLSEDSGNKHDTGLDPKAEGL